MKRRLAIFVPALFALGCGPQYESPSKLTSLRVLAVQKDKPYAKPGDTVNFRMLLDDAAQPTPRGVKVTWFGGCEDPPADLYAGCFAGLAGVSTGELGLKPSVPQVGEGLTFSLKLSDDIISFRGDQGKFAYGTAYVFFAVCPGDVRIVPPENGKAPETLPIQCVAKSGDVLGADDFILGYSQVFAYERFTNANPIVNGFELAGSPITPECIGLDCLALEAAELGIDPGGFGRIGGDAGTATDGGDAGSPVDGGDGGTSDGGTSAPDAGKPAADAGPPGAPDPCIGNHNGCLNVCNEDKETDCEGHEMRIVVDPSSAEHDTVQSERENKTIFEQMWVNYYTDAGKIRGDVKLLSDASLGFRENNPAKIFPPKTPGPFHVWAVAHDNRGGSEWIRVKLSARKP